MAVTAADVQAFAPQFAAVTTGVINSWLSMAAGAIDAVTYGSEADNATLLWVCHHLQTTQPASAGSNGPVTDRKVGDVSTGSAASPATASALNTTAYGQSFMRLCRRFTAGPIVAL